MKSSHDHDTDPSPTIGRGGVLIASPSTVLREQVLNSFGDSGRAVREASGGADALVQLENGDWQLLFLDRRLPDLDTEELIGIIKRRFPGIEVVLLDSDSDQTVPQVRDREDVRGASHAGMAMEDWKSFLPSRNPEAAPVDPLPGMIGNAACMQQLYQMVRLVAGRSITALVLGATGTGKELVANALHKLGPRATRPFVIVNCAAIPEALLESELFGHVRGAFTGAVQSRLGASRRPAGERCFSMKSARCRPGCRRSCCAFWSKRKYNVWAARTRTGWTFA